jgi:hypothetical protein
MFTPETAFVLQEHQRLLVEMRVLREWILEMASGGDAARRDRLDAQMQRQIDHQLGQMLERLEANVSPAVAAQLDDRSAEEVLNQTAPP